MAILTRCESPRLLSGKNNRRQAGTIQGGTTSMLAIRIALAAMAKRLRDAHGFDADLAHSAIVGICRECRVMPA